MPYSLLQVAEAFVRTGELTDALEILHQQLTAVPDDDEARRLRAAVRLRLAGDEHLRAALNDLDALAAPAADDYVQRSIICQRLNDLPAALAAMQPAHRQQPDDDRITARLLDLLLLTGDRRAAYDLLTALPASWRWLERAGDLARDDNNHAAAVNAYTAALEHLDERMDTGGSAFAAALKTALLAKRAGARLAAGQPEQAEADYRLLEQRMPSDAAYPFCRGLARAQQGDIAGALVLCRAALARANDTLRAELWAALDTAAYAELREGLKLEM